MKFVDAILSNNSTDDHCREFVQQKGLVPLMGILGLPNLPIDFPAHAACQAVAAVSKSILNLAHEPQVLKQGLLHLNEVLKGLEPLHKPVDAPGGSVLLRELVRKLVVKILLTMVYHLHITARIQNQDTPVPEAFDYLTY
jgi:E3 ubiquitin-protein ligase HUWE1